MISIHKCFLALFLIYCTIQAKAQSEAKNIIKVTYTSTPISQYKMTESHMQDSPTKASLHEFMKGITDYYSLYINVKDRSSIYVLDSTVQKRPIGWENPRTTAALADTVLFSIKTTENKTFKHEWIMNQTFYTEGEVGNIEWVLTNEQKKIKGLNCFKAKSKSSDYPMLTVWYTKELPVSNGPSVYQGLPGLVVVSEDYFRTIQIQKIEYNSEIDFYETLYKTKYNIFIEEKKKKKHYDIEPILLIKKGDLATGLYEYYHKKPYKR